MSLRAADQKFIDAFFEAIEKAEPAYEHVGFSYIALKTGTTFVIVSGRLFLYNVQPEGPSQHFTSPNVRAGHYRLPELSLDLRGFLAQLLEGQMSTPAGPLYFPAGSSGQHGASFAPLHPEGLRSQSRFSVLTIMGAEQEHIPQPDIDWEIKTGSPPYDSIQELAQIFGVDLPIRPTIAVEFVAFNVAVIDAAASKVSGRNADVHVRVAKRLPRERFTLAYRVYLPGMTTQRGTIAGSAIEWTDGETVDVGRVSITIPNAAVLNCAIAYDGITQNHFWLSDPRQAQNPRRVAYETFDPRLENLKSTLITAQPRGQDSRDFEASVAWLLWMLGFNGAHLGTGRRSRDAPDQIFVAPSGNFAIVECTMGLLKAENKLALLHDRTEAVRRKLAASNYGHLRLLPVIVTAKTATEIRPDVEAAERLGIFIVTRESLEQAIDRTLQQPYADEVYAEAERAVSAALNKYQNQGPPVVT